MSGTVLFQNESWVWQFECGSWNFFGRETRRVRGNNSEDCSCSNWKTHWETPQHRQCVQTSKEMWIVLTSLILYCNTLKQHKTAKAKKLQRGNISKQLSGDIWENYLQASFEFKVFCETVAQPGIRYGLIKTVVLLHMIKNIPAVNGPWSDHTNNLWNIPC